MSTLEMNRLESQVLAMCEKYQYEEQHCRRVAALSQRLFDLLAPIHKMGEDEALLLRHAALLHDLGHFINYRGHHRHGAYLIRHDATLAGYPEEERELIAHVVRNHRKKPAEAPANFSGARARTARQLSAILRFADGLDHDRAGTAAITGCDIGEKKIDLQITGVAMEDQAEVLKDKAHLIKPAFERKLTWRTLVPTEVAPAEAAETEAAPAEAAETEAAPAKAAKTQPAPVKAAKMAAAPAKDGQDSA